MFYLSNRRFTSNNHARKILAHILRTSITEADINRGLIMKTLSPIVLFSFFITVLFTALPAWPAKNEIVTYQINAELNTRKKIITASETITWRNKTKNPAPAMRFHLYYNAFRSADTTFLREDSWHRKDTEELADTRFGGITIKSLRLKNGPRLTGISYPTPDDDNKKDRTVMEVRFPSPVPPRGEVTLVIDFEVKIPEIISRTGAVDDYYFIAQWFPKPGVFMPDGTWHCHQYHYNAEYFADYGSFRVSITLPKTFTVGATGTLEKELKNNDGTITRIYTEENIHDFVWTAWPDYQVHKEKISLSGKRGKTDAVLLYAPWHKGALERNRKSLAFAMKFFSKKIMPYPYKKITLIDAPWMGMQSWGMEYPTLFTTAHMPFTPGFYHLAEKVTIHEFGHQYWYGIIGFDETREAWLDEGINTFFEMEIMEAYFAGAPSFLGIPPINLYDWQDRRTAYTSMAHVDKAATFSWEFMDYLTYRGNVYTKTALLFLSLKGLVGEKKLYGFFRAFVRKWQYSHPTGEDFIKDFNAYMRKDYSWAFDQFTKGHVKLDHAVHFAESFEVNHKKGKYENEIVLVRDGGWFPVECLVSFTDGSQKKLQWNNPGQWKRYTFYSKVPLSSVVLDPFYRVPLDVNFINNSHIIEGDYSHGSAFLSHLGGAVQTLLSILVF